MYGTVGSERRRCCLNLCWLHHYFTTLHLPVLVSNKHTKKKETPHPTTQKSRSAPRSIMEHLSAHSINKPPVAFASKNGLSPSTPPHHLEGPAITAHHLQRFRPRHHLRWQPIAGGARGLWHRRSALPRKRHVGDSSCWQLFIRRFRWLIYPKFYSQFPSAWLQA